MQSIIRTRERREEREQPLGFSWNEPFFNNEGYKTNKVIKVFNKKQVNEFIGFKIVIILNFRNKNVIIVLYVKDVDESAA